MRLRGLKLNAYGTRDRINPWTPAVISTASWWDAADVSTITLNGATVSQWADKSGNNRHMVQASAGLQPSYGFTSFSLPSVNFGDDFMASASISGAASDWAIYGVNKQTETSPPSNDSILASNATGAGMFQVGSSATSLTVSANADGTSIFFGLAVDPSIAPNYRLLGLETSTASGTSSYLNGTVAATNAATVRNTATVGFKLNVNRAGGLYLQSDHAEWIVLPSVPATAVRQQIEGYLAWKWGGIPQSRLWTPADIGAALALWLDANDASTITLNGSTVSQWSDKSGNNRHVSQATTANQPTYLSTGFNGKPALSFDGVDDFMPMNNVLAIGNSQAASLSSFAVFNFSSAPAVNRFVFRGGAGGSPSLNTDYAVFVGSADSLYRFGTGSSTDSTAWQVLPTPLASADQLIFSGVMAASSGTTGTKASYMNGTLRASGNYAIKGPAATEAAIGALINAGAGSAFFQGNMTEVIMTTSALSTQDRQRTEGYLAHKWGLSANLPVDHPYRTVAPTVAI